MEEDYIGHIWCLESSAPVLLDTYVLQNTTFLFQKAVAELGNRIVEKIIG